MPVADKYRLQRQIGWSDEAEVHAGPPDAAHGGVPVAVKIRHGMGGPPRPDGNRARFLRAVNDQQAAVLAGCRQVAPIFETGSEGDNAYYVTQHYQRSLDSLIQGRVVLAAPVLRRLTAGVLQALEELRDRHGRAHGNLKPTNIFLDGKTVTSARVVLGDLALREEAGSQGVDAYALGAVLYQLVRGRSIRNFDWPIEPGPDWERLGPQADPWREFCNVLMSPEVSAQPDALVRVRDAFKNMRRLGAAAAKGAKVARPRGEAGIERPAAPRRKGLWAGIGAGIAAVSAAVAMLFQPADSKLGKQFRSLPVLASLFSLVDLPRPTVALPAWTPPPPVTGPTATPPLVAQASPTPATPEPTATPVMAEATPPPPVVNPGDKWIGYGARLTQFRSTVNDPALLDQPDVMISRMIQLKDDVGFLPVKDEPSVAAFLALLPPKIEATGDQADLPATLWTKEATTRQDDVQSITYQWNNPPVRVVFNRVNATGGNGPAFYLSATVVPVQLGVRLAKIAETDGKGPLSGASSPKGPVAWQVQGGNYYLRPSWMVADSVNTPLYAAAGRPTGDSPMNGLNAVEAFRLARAAGCALPTLAQWDAVLASPSGQQWTEEWQSAAKVRSPQWAEFAKRIQSQHITGAKLPNDQCFGDRNDLGAVTQTADPNLFFEPVNTRVLKGFAHLIGNVGQYVVNDARNPTKYYFAGGSAEAAPSVFQSLTAPPEANPYVAAADGGLRLAAPAKGSGSDKNPVLDKLKHDLDVELARVQKLQ